MIYDEAATSCAALLWERLYKEFNYRNDKYTELVVWADKIDSARYSSAEEAVYSSAPALQLALGLALGDTTGYCSNLVRLLLQDCLEEVARVPAARQRAARVRELIDLGLDRFKRSAYVDQGLIVIFDVDSRDVIVSRYAPYYCFPEARYSVGILQFEDLFKVTAMRNPWCEFRSVPLGKIAGRLGGGGHHRVASIAVRDRFTAEQRRDELLEEIRRGEGHQNVGHL